MWKRQSGAPSGSSAKWPTKNITLIYHTKAGSGGDILTDEAAGIVGGLGMAPGLCEGPEYLMAQATHGSAPDIAGKHIANPYAVIISSQMLLARLGERKDDSSLLQAAEDVQRGASEVLAEMKTVTVDLGGSASTEEMGDAISQKIKSL